MSAIRREDLCHGCGRPVLFIKCCDRKTHTAEPEPVWVNLDPKGGTFITKEGKFVFGQIVGDAYDTDDAVDYLVEAYIPHKGRCPMGGRKRRRR